MNILKTTIKNKNKGLTLKSPLIGASGTFGYADEFEDFIDLNCLGAVSTKAITLNPRCGSEGDRIFETDCGLINRIGLENIGIKKFIIDKLPVLKRKNIDFLLNIAGASFEDYEKLAIVAKKNDIKALEVNVSCPNVKSGCLEFGLNPDILYNLVSKIRKNYNGFLIVKLSPNTSDISLLAKASESAGADCISAINTLRGLGVEVKKIGNKFTKRKIQGGLSGSCIKHVGLYMVNQIKQNSKIPVIAAGGISKFDDILEYLAAGADAFQIGTANFTNPSICTRLASELKNYIEEGGFRDFEDLKSKIQGE